MLSLLKCFQRPVSTSWCMQAAAKLQRQRQIFPDYRRLAFASFAAVRATYTAISSTAEKADPSMVQPDGTFYMGPGTLKYADQLFAYQ